MLLVLYKGARCVVADHDERRVTSNLPNGGLYNTVRVLSKSLNSRAADSGRDVGARIRGTKGSSTSTSTVDAKLQYEFETGWKNQRTTEGKVSSLTQTTGQQYKLRRRPYSGLRVRDRA